MEDKEEIKWILDLIESKEKEDEIVFLTYEGFKSCKIEDMLNQHLEGILYDLNRNLEVLKTLINPKENKWCVNEIAFVTLFKRIFNKLKEHEEEKHHISNWDAGVR